MEHTHTHTKEKIGQNVQSALLHTDVNKFPSELDFGWFLTEKF